MRINLTLALLLTVLSLGFYAPPCALADDAAKILKAFTRDLVTVSSMPENNTTLDRIESIHTEFQKSSDLIFKDKQVRTWLEEKDYLNILKIISRHFNGRTLNRIYVKEIALPLAKSFSRSRGIESADVIYEIIRLVSKDLKSKEYAEIKPALILVVAHSDIADRHTREHLIRLLCKMYINVDHTQGGAEMQHFLGDAILYAIVKLASQNDRTNFEQFKKQMTQHRSWEEKKELGFSRKNIKSEPAEVTAITDIGTVLGLLSALKGDMPSDSLDQLLSILDYAIYKNAPMSDLFYGRLYDDPDTKKVRRAWRETPWMALPTSIKKDLITLLETSDPQVRVELSERIGERLCTSLFIN